MSKDEQPQTLREILIEFHGKGHPDYPYDHNGALQQAEAAINDHIDKVVEQESETAYRLGKTDGHYDLNAHIVSVLEELKERKKVFTDGLHLSETAVTVKDIDAAIAAYKPTPEEQKRIDFHKEVSNNAAAYKKKGTDDETTQ